MAKLRKTLPKDFQDLLNKGDMEQIKSVLEKCELYAYSGSSKNTALFFNNIPDELVRYLVLEKGMDINYKNRYGSTALQEQIVYRGKNLELFIELGADIQTEKNFVKETPLHTAANWHNVDAVRLLLAHDAKLDAKNFNQENPLETMLHQCRNMDIEKAAVISKIFLEAGVKISDKMKAYVKKIGENFEFHRDNFNPDYLESTENGLKQLYELFSVPPVPPLNRHDGKSQITVIKGPWYKQHDALWKLLVPGSGHAKTIQGEVIRISGKVAYEVMDNGGMNWDSDYRKMVKFLVECFASSNHLTQEEQEEAKKIEQLISRFGQADNEPERLMELAVKWVAQNPEPMEIGTVQYTR